MKNSIVEEPNYSACVVWIDDPFKREVVNRVDVEAGASIQSLIDDGIIDLTTDPKHVLLNAKVLLEADFEKCVSYGDVVTIIPATGNPFVIAFYVVAGLVTAYSAYVALTFTVPDYDTQYGASPTYTTDYNGNRARPGGVLPCIYGEMMTYPDLIGAFPIPIVSPVLGTTRLFSRQLFNITVGEIEDLVPEDIDYAGTPLTSFSEYRIEHIKPGETSQLYSSAVYTSATGKDVELNEMDWSGSHEVNPVGTEITEIMVIMSAPQGMYIVNHKGNLFHAGVGFHFEYRLVGSGSWTRTGITYIPISREPYWTKFSIIDLPPGRYELRAARTKLEAHDLQVAEKVVVSSIHGLQKNDTVTDTTRLAIEILADETAGSNPLSKLRVRARRKVPIWSGSSWSAPTHTTKAVWAFADALRSEIYGGSIPDSRIDLDTLKALESRTPGDFNGVFDTEMPLWEALSIITKPMLARQVEYASGVYSIQPDDEDAIPVAMYTMRNIIDGSFSVDQDGFTTDTHDSVRVAFLDKDEAYRENTVLCTPSGSTDSNIKEIKVRGVTDADAAYEVGIRLANEIRWRRKRLAFSTGIEGFNVQFGDALRVHHFMLGLEESKQSYSGEVKSNSGSSLTVYEDISTLIGVGGLVVFLRNLDGSPQGPLNCSVPNANQINISSGFDSSVLVYGNNIAGPLYAIGLGADFFTTIKVVSVSDEGNGEVSIEGYEDNQNAYIKGGVPVLPPLGDRIDGAPVVTDLAYELLGPNDRVNIQLAWKAENADYVVVEWSLDQTNWTLEARTTESSYTFQLPSTPPYEIYIKVTPYGAMIGQSQELHVNYTGYTMGLRPAKNLRALRPFDGEVAEIAFDAFPDDQRTAIWVRWHAIVHGDDYEVRHIVPYGTDTFSFSREQCTNEKAVMVYGQKYPILGARTLEFVVLPRIVDGDGNVIFGEEASITLHNEQLERLYDVVWRESGPNLIISFQWPDTDYGGVVVYMSDTPGFTPNASTRVHKSDSNDFTIPNVLGEHPSTHYLRLAGHDLWGVYDEVNMSDEVQINTTADGGMGTGSINWGDIGDPDGTKPEDNATETDLTSVLLDPMFSKTLALNNSNRYWEGVAPNSDAYVIEDAGVAVLMMEANGGYNIVRGQKFFDAAPGTKFTVTSRFAWENLDSRIDARLVAFEYDENFQQTATYNMLHCTYTDELVWATKASRATVSAGKTRYVKFGWLIGPDNNNGKVYVSYIRLMGTGAADWQDMYDDGTGTKPDDFANVTIDNLPGDGYNRIPATYQSYSANEFFPYLIRNSSSYSNREAGTSDAGTGLYGESALYLANNRPSGTGAGSWDCRMAADTSEFNILVESGFRYLISFVSNGDGTTCRGRIYFRGQSGQVYFPRNISGMDGSADGTFSTYSNSSWKDHLCYINLESANETAMVMEVGQTDSSTRVLYLDGFFMECVRSSSATLEIDEPQNRSPFRGFSKNAIKTRHLIPEAITGIFAVGPSSLIALPSSVWVDLCSVDITYIEDSILIITGSLSTVAGLNGELLLSVRFYIDGVLQDPAYIKPAFSGISQTQSQIISEITYITPDVQSTPVEVKMQGRSSGITTTAEVEGTTLKVTEYRR